MYNCICMYSRMAKYCLIADISDRCFQATVIHNMSRAQDYRIPCRTTYIALLREFLLRCRFLFLQSLSVIFSYHHEVPLHHPKCIHCVLVYIFFKFTFKVVELANPLMSAGSL